MSVQSDKKVFIKTYGCQMNVYDSERMQDVLRGEGYIGTDAPDEADLVILNTCHIREKAAEKGLKVKPFVKTSMAPGSKVVTDYPEATFWVEPA